MSLYVVTGTDTGVVKTYVTIRIIEALRRSGIDAIGLKPLETGWDEPSSDARQLAIASGRSVESTIWRHYGMPAAPAVAAAAEDQRVDARELLTWLRRQATGHDVCLVEGAGGWMVPITDDLLFSDLVKQMDAAGVLVVGASRLGTINHTLLTAEAVARDASLLAIAVSTYPDEASADSNRTQIAARASVPVHLVPAELDRLTPMFHVEQRAHAR
jgi:dethiobiotin synthetase